MAGNDQSIVVAFSYSFGNKLPLVSADQDEIKEISHTGSHTLTTSRIHKDVDSF